MKAALVIALCLGAAFAMTDVEKWQYFKNMHGRKFVGMGEENSRFLVFRANLRTAELLQAQDEHASFGITQFMDLTPEEFQAQYLGLNLTALQKWRKNLPEVQVGAGPVVDWVNGPKKAVATVKDQGNCGSCWAFSAAAGLEGCAMLKNGGQNVDISAQQIVDCCTAGGSDGCNGGWEDQALNWAVSQDMATWASYTYTARKSTCRRSGFTVAVPKGTCRFVQTTGTETATVGMLANGPVSIALAANNLQYYTGGIISGTSCKDSQVNHAVLLVANSGSAVTIKNSWGTSWGERGYFRLTAGSNCMHFGDENAQALPY